MLRKCPWNCPSASRISSLRTVVFAILSSINCLAGSQDNKYINYLVTSASKSLPRFTPWTSHTHKVLAGAWHQTGALASWRNLAMKYVVTWRRLKSNPRGQGPHSSEYEQQFKSIPIFLSCFTVVLCHAKVLLYVLFSEWGEAHHYFCPLHCYFVLLFLSIFTFYQNPGITSAELRFLYRFLASHAPITNMRYA